MSGYALLFDLDGTLAHSDGLHYVAFQRCCEKYFSDFTLTEEYFEREIHGRSNADIFTSLMQREVAGEELQRLADEKEACYRQLVAERGITALPGGKDFMHWAREQGFRVGIVTNAPRLNAESMLAALELTHAHHECLIIGEECAAMKPSPVPYLDGAKTLGTSIEKCIVFEDSPAGLKSAIASEPLAVVGLTSTLPSEKLLQHGAHHTVDDYCDNSLRDFVMRRIQAIEKSGCDDCIFLNNNND